MSAISRSRDRCQARTLQPLPRAPPRGPKGIFPVSVLNAVKAVPEVCRVYCATANPVAVVVAKLGDDRKVSCGGAGALGQAHVRTIPAWPRGW
jgi:hypothetical protein